MVDGTSIFLSAERCPLFLGMTLYDYKFPLINKVSWRFIFPHGRVEASCWRQNLKDRFDVLLLPPFFKNNNGPEICPSPTVPFQPCSYIKNSGLIRMVSQHCPVSYFNKDKIWSLSWEQYYNFDISYSVHVVLPPTSFLSSRGSFLKDLSAGRFIACHDFGLSVGPSCYFFLIPATKKSRSFGFKGHRLHCNHFRTVNTLRSHKRNSCH